MRLRYLHLPDYGVLKDLRVPFDRELMFRQPGKLHRQGDLHFVVGLNGTGKSSLLRAIYETFRWLEGVNGDLIDPRMPFPFPITLIYDLPATLQVDYERTCVFHHQGHSVSAGFFFAAMSSLNEADHGGWDGWIEWLKQYASSKSAEQIGRLIRADQLQGNNRVTASLPSPLLVYTSGSLAIWSRVHEQELPPEDLSATTSDQIHDERPRGWDINRELGSADVTLGDSERSSLRQLLDPNVHATASRCRLLDPLDLKLAAIAIGLSVAAGEIVKLQSDELRDLWRRELSHRVQGQRRGERQEHKTARTLLNEVDWWFPTHLSIKYRPTSAKLNPEWHAQQLVLCALADEVIRQPLDRMQSVISLGPRTCQIREDIKSVYVDRKIPVEVDEVISRVDGSTSGAQAVLRALCTEESARYDDETEPDFARWPVFDRLQAWRRAGLIENISVTIKKVTQTQSSDGQQDDVVVTWEDLSDGEQMVLGRMSLLLLLSKQHGSLLLLDEPETHFNDSWKREIIDIIDDNILKTTEAHVVVATHTSIALTDAFASEIIRLIRSDGKSIFKPVSFATFGAEPGRIMLNVFDMPEAIGSRAAEVLRILLEEVDWQGNRLLLEHVVAEIGGGWPRARLREILEGL